MARTATLNRRSFTDAERRALLDEAQQRRMAGEKWATITQALGVSYQALYEWRRTSGESGFAPVVLDTSRPAATLVTPGGYRVEGLGFADLVALIRALA